MALLRTPGVEPGSQAWEACMMPLHYVRSRQRGRRGAVEWRLSCLVLAATFLFFSFCFLAEQSCCVTPSPWGRCNAHAGSRTRVTSMGGLYDAATLRALVVVAIQTAPAMLAFCTKHLHARHGPRGGRESNPRLAQCYQISSRSGICAPQSAFVCV